MSAGLGIIVLVGLVIAVVLLRAHWNLSAVEKWSAARGFQRRFPVPPEGPQPAASLLARLSRARLWGLVLEGTMDGVPVTIAEHESAVIGQDNNAWFTVVTWPIDGATGSITLQRNTGPKWLSEVGAALSRGVSQPVIQALGLAAAPVGEAAETPGGWNVYAAPPGADGWVTPAKIRELDAWSQGGAFVRADGHGAWRLEGTITVESLERLTAQFTAARRLLQAGSSV